jgi:hypothetical protein
MLHAEVNGGTIVWQRFITPGEYWATPLGAVGNDFQAEGPGLWRAFIVDTEIYSDEVAITE